MKKIVFVLLWSLIYPLFADIFIEKTQVQGRIEENSVYLTLTIQAQKRGNQWESLDFLPKNIQILQQEGEALLKREQGRFFLYLQQEGKYTSSFQLKLNLQKEQEQTFFQFPYTPGSIAEFNLEIPSKDLQIQLDSLSFLLEQRTEENKTFLKIIPSAQCEVRWQSVQAIQKLAPLTYAQNTTLIETLEGEIRYQETLQIQVVRGGIDVLHLTIPESQKLFKLQGNDLKWWELRENRLQIHFQKKIEKTAYLFLELRQFYPQGLPTQVTLQPVQIEEVAVQNGVLALEKGEIISQELHVKDLEREDIESFRHLGKELMATYQFRGKDPQLQVELKKRPPQVECVLHHNFHYSKETVSFQSFVHFRVTEAKVGQLLLNIPKTMQIHSLKEALPPTKAREIQSSFAPALRSWEQNGDEILLQLKEQRVGLISFFLEGQLTEIPNGATLPFITAPQCKTVSGKLGVSHESNLKLLVEQSQDLTQINITELPQELFSKTFQPKFGFSFGQKPFSLLVKTTPLKPYLTTNAQTLYRLSPENIQFEAIYDLRLKDVGIFQLLIPLRTGLDITEVRSKENQIDFWERKDNQLLVKFAQEVKACKLELKGLLSAQTSGTLEIFFPKDSQKNEGILVVDPDAEFLLHSTLLKELEEKPRSDSPFAVGNLARVFKTTEKEASFQYSVTLRTPEIKGNLFTLYTFVRGYIVTQSEVQLQIEQAGIRKFTVKLPKKAGNLIITGSEILDFYPREEDYQIELKNKVRGPLTFFINYDLPFNVFGESTCTLEGIDFPEAKELKGFEGWKKSEIPIEVLLDRQKGYDTHPSPKAPRQTPSNRFTLAQDSFGIKERTRQIQLKIKGLDQTFIQEVQISDLNIRTEVNEEGKLTTRLTCRFNNTTRQFLRIRVDQKAILWGTYITQEWVATEDNKIQKEGERKEKTPVKPTIGKNGEILVPIPKNVQDAELEMVFVDTLKKMSYIGDLDLMSPAIEDAQVEKLSWDLVVPKNYLLIQHQGPFELKPVHSSLLPDSLAVYLQKEVVGTFKSFLPKFLFASERGAWVAITLILLGLICFTLFYGYHYFGPDSFLAILGKFCFLTLTGFVLYFTYQEEPTLSFILAGTLGFGWLLYRARVQIIDIFLTSHGPSRSSVFTLLCVFALLCIVAALMLPSLNKARSSSPTTFSDARQFQELRDGGSYDDSEDHGRHKTGRMSDDYDSYRPVAPSSKAEPQKQLRANAESRKKNVLEENRRKNDSTKAKRQLEKVSPETESATGLDADGISYEEELEFSKDKEAPEEPSFSDRPFDSSSLTDSLSDGEKSPERKLNEKLGRVEGKSEESLGLESDPKPIIDPVQRERERVVVNELQAQIDILEDKLQSGELDNIGALFYQTYQKANNQNFIVLQDEKMQLQGQLKNLQQQIGQQIVIQENAPGNGPADPSGKKGGVFNQRDPAEESYQDGQQLLQQGRFQEAIQELNKSIVFNPNNPRALDLLKEAQKRLELSQELAKTLQVTWDKAEAKLTSGELEEASKLLTEIQRQGAPFARNPKIKDLLQQAQDREKLLAERLGQLRNWKRMTRERIQQQIQDKFQIKLTGNEINLDEFTVQYPQNPSIQTAIEKLLQQAKQDLQNLRKSVLSGSAFQQSLGMEGLSEQFARVKNGRSAGALPIPVNLPAENRVGFSFELTLTDKPESIKFVFMNRTISYFWQVLFMGFILGGLYGVLCKKGIEASWLGFFATLLLLTSLQNVVDTEYLPYLKTGLYATAFFLPVLVYQHFSKWLMAR